MWLNQDFTCTFTHICYFCCGSTIHIYPSISISRITQKYSTPNPGENNQKYFCFFPCEINAQVILLLPLAILSHEMSALKKRREKNIYEEIKRGKCPEPRKKRKSETRGKNGQVSDNRIRGTRYPPERKEKRKYRASYSPQKASKCKKGMYPLKRAKVELDFHHCFHHYHHHHHTPFIRHTCTS